MEEWKEYKLGELADIQTGPFGSQLHQHDYVDAGTPCIMPTNIGSHLDIQSDRIAHVKAEDVMRLSKHCVKTGDILYSRRGDIEKCAFIRPQEEGWLCGTGCLRIRTNSQKANSHFIAYQLSTKECKKWIVGNAVGTTMLNLNSGILKELPLYMPNRQIQDSVVAILKSLDDKIEVNRKINENLEQQAQAMFKSWFVDFEPFKNGEFVESELGMIPKGWRVVSLDEMTSKFGTGLNPRKNFKLGEGTNYYVTIKNMGNNRFYLDDRCDKVTDEAIEKINKRSKLQTGDLLFSGIGTIGRVALITETPNNWNTSESVFNMHPTENISSEFLYILLLSDIFQQYVKLHAQGGVQQGIRMASLKEYSMAIPDDLVLRQFDNVIIPIISRIKNIDKQNDSLAELRDTLLPKLMSGEIKVNEININ